MGLPCIEIEAVALVEHQHFFTYRNFEYALENKVEFFTVMRILRMILITRKRINLREKRVYLSASESRSQTLILIVVAPFHPVALAFSGKIVSAHLGFFSE